MGAVSAKFVSAVRIARERGLKGLAGAAGRNLGLATLYPGIGEPNSARGFFGLRTTPGISCSVSTHYGSAVCPSVCNGQPVHAVVRGPCR